MRRLVLALCLAAIAPSLWAQGGIVPGRTRVVRECSATPDTEACQRTGQFCLSGINAYCCNTANGTYDLCGASASGLSCTDCVQTSELDSADTPAVNECVKVDSADTTKFLFDACASGGGDNISVNGVAATDADLDDATPAAPADGVNVRWQKDALTPNNVSANVPLAGAAQAGALSTGAQTLAGAKTWTGAQEVEFGNAAIGHTLDSVNAAQPSPIQIFSPGDANTDVRLQALADGRYSIQDTNANSQFEFSPNAAIGLRDLRVLDGRMDAQIGFRVASAATLGRYLRGDGTNFVQSGVAAAGAGDCGAGNFARTLNDNAVPTCATDDDVPEAADYTNLTAGRSLTKPVEGTIDADAELYTDTKCLNIDPAATTTDWFFYRTDAAITVTGIDCIVDAATSVVLTLRECDANGGTCAATEAAITCATTNTTEAAGIDDAAVDAGDWMRLLRGTVTGSPTQAVLCMTFTAND